MPSRCVQKPVGVPKSPTQPSIFSLRRTSPGIFFSSRSCCSSASCYCFLFFLLIPHPSSATGSAIQSGMAADQSAVPAPGEHSVTFPSAEPVPGVQGASIPLAIAVPGGQVVFFIISVTGPQSLITSHQSSVIYPQSPAISRQSLRQGSQQRGARWLQPSQWRPCLKPPSHGVEHFINIQSK